MADRLFGIPYTHHTAAHLELILNHAGFDTELGESKQTLFELAQGFERSLDERTRHNIERLVEDLVLQRRNLRRKEEQLEHVLVSMSAKAEIVPREPGDHEDEDIITGFKRGGEVVELDEDGDVGNDHLRDADEAMDEEGIAASLRRVADETERQARLFMEPLEPEVRTCQVCLEDLAIDEFPLRTITAACEHEAEVCLDHLRDYILVQLVEHPANELTCPSCHERLLKDDVQLLGDQELFDAYCQRAFLDFLRKEPNYYHCLGPNCGASQIHEQEEEAAPLMRCHSCGYGTCIQHQIAWHDGQTCEDYDLWKADNLHRDEENAASEAEIRNNAKRCPACFAPSVKISGCDHVTCQNPLCHHEFCWVCLIRWVDVTHGNYHPAI
ncbi:hypothetical protein BDZ45DRAFT_14305 [Acephala macrosclerotiorum]|nr:hypothetical protein BDZ45DRAFT_14305 [Acephala macrosclerotiorum]